MFTGLVETTGIITEISGNNKRKKIKIKASGSFTPPADGGSVAVDGVCQTIVSSSSNSFIIEALEQTILKTTFSGYKQGRIVNLEKALVLSDPLGGHFVQGHVNGTGVISDITESGRNIYMEISAEKSITDYCITEGSICIDGISFTIAKIIEGKIIINVIPETWSRTALSAKKSRDRVNIETDILGRYVYSFIMQKSSGNPDLTMEKLKNWGF